MVNRGQVFHAWPSKPWWQRLRRLATRKPRITYRESMPAVSSLPTVALPAAFQAPDPPPLQIILGAGGNLETKKAKGLYKTTHTFIVAVKNSDSERFLSNCKFYLDIPDQKDGNQRSYLLIDTFTLNASEVRCVPIVSYDESHAGNRSEKDHICLLIPVGGAWFAEIGTGWPWQMPVGSYTFTLRATSKETGPCEVVCRIWVDDAGKLHFERV
jgi:hypothetical protein